jgi:hypothetical protein
MQQSELSTKGQPVSTTQNSAVAISLEQGEACCQAALVGLSSLPNDSGLGSSTLHFIVTVLVFLVVVTNVVLTSVYSTPTYSVSLPIQNYSILPVESSDLNLVSNGWVPDLTQEGIEPNPGPQVKITAEQLHSAKKKLRKTGSKVPKAPAIILQNAPPRSRELQNKMRKSQYLSGDTWNPRADMMGYFQTLMDAERYPPVRLGGETMVPTGLTTLHGLFSYAITSGGNASIVIHPRVFAPVSISSTASAPYTYSGYLQFPSATTATIQSLAAAARVVSAKLKVYTTASATSDNGALIVGLCPRDPGFLGATNLLPNFSNASVIPPNTAVSDSGYPIIPGSYCTTATQGFNEFGAEDWTDTVPLKNGASIFWLPQDPHSMTFEAGRILQVLNQQANASGVAAGTSFNATEINDPFFCIGITGATSGSIVNFELFLNLEYTVTAGASSVVETRPGCMNSVQQFEVAKRLGGNLQNTVEPDPEASLGEKLGMAGKAILKGGAKRVSEFLFGSSDVGNIVSSILF